MKKVFTLILSISLLFSCSDPCDDINCLNGGTCVEGQCNCAQGYSGADCSTKDDPAQIEITKVTLTSYSLFDSQGVLWDNGPDPDTGYCDIKIRYTGSSGDMDFTTVTSMAFEEHADPNLEHDFFPINDLIITDMNDYQFIHIIDGDTFSVQDNMKSFSFQFNSFLNDLPPTISLVEGGYSIEIEVIYTY